MVLPFPRRRLLLKSPEEGEVDTEEAEEESASCELLYEEDRKGAAEGWWDDRYKYLRLGSTHKNTGAGEDLLDTS
jgi:hypothetical protein